jgi:AcrR family transcriptional regulator
MFSISFVDRYSAVAQQLEVIVDMAREPVQERSLDSMRRMLDAGEVLFLEGGGGNLKVDLIVAASQTSMGSFYARFGDMHGYRVALHKRTLETIGAALAEVTAQARLQGTLADTLEVYCEELIKVLQRFRSQFYYFAVANSHDHAFRSDGAQATLTMRAAFLDLVKPYIVKPSTGASRRRLDMAFRLILAFAFQQIMFTQEEVSTFSVNDSALAREWAATLTASLAPFTLE